MITAAPRTDYVGVDDADPWHNLCAHRASGDETRTRDEGVDNYGDWKTWSGALDVCTDCGAHN